MSTQQKFYKFYQNIFKQSENELKKGNFGELVIKFSKVTDKKTNILILNPNLAYQEIFKIISDKLLELNQNEKYLTNDNDFEEITPFLLYDNDSISELLIDSFKGFSNIIKSEYFSCYGSWETTKVAAEKGYGPLIYSLAASWVKKFGNKYNKIMSDRGSVQPAAKNVWKKTYLDRNDFKKVKLDNHKKPETLDKWDDCKIFDESEDELNKYLNYAYEIQNPILTDPLEDGYDNFIKTLSIALKNILFINTDLNYIKNILEEYLNMVGDLFFNKKYIGSKLENLDENRRIRKLIRQIILEQNIVPLKDPDPINLPSTSRKPIRHSAVQQDNKTIEFLTNMKSNGSPSGNDLSLFKKFFGKEYWEFSGEDKLKADELLTKMLEILPGKIKRKIGSSLNTQGKLFLLDSEYIVKFFQQDYSVAAGRKSDLIWYDEISDRLFSGKGSHSDLPIIDYGRIEIDNNFFINYVIMARVIPFDQFIIQTGRDASFILGNMQMGTPGQLQRINRAVQNGESFNNFFKEEKNYIPTQFDSISVILSDNFKFEANLMFGVYHFMQNEKLQNYGDLPARLTNKHGHGSLDWYENGKKHRLGDKPTKVSFSIKGSRDINLKNARWDTDDRGTHRENNLPAVIARDANDNLFKLGYYDNNILTLEISELSDETYELKEYNENSKYDPINTTIIDKSNSSWNIINDRVNKAKREFNNINAETQKYFDFFQQKINEFSNSGSTRITRPKGLNQAEMRAIFKMLKRLRRTVGEKYDFHGQNFGIFQHSNPSKPVFVMYDI